MAERAAKCPHKHSRQILDRRHIQTTVYDVGFRTGCSRSCPVRPPAWDAAWPPVAVLRSHVAPRQQRLRRLGVVAPWEIVIQLCAADSRETRKYPILNTMSWDLVV